LNLLHFCRGKLQPGVDLDHTSALLDLMEGQRPSDWKGEPPSIGCATFLVRKNSDLSILSRNPIGGCTVFSLNLEGLMSTRLTLVLFLVVIGSSASDKKKDPAESVIATSARDQLLLHRKGIALGQQLALEVEKQAKMVDDPILGEYINVWGRNLVRIPMPRCRQLQNHSMTTPFNASRCGRPCLR